MIVNMPFAEEYRKLAPNPDGFPGAGREADRAREGADGVGSDVKALKTPVLIITSDADVATLEHSVAMFRLLGGGVMGDMGKPLPASRLAVCRRRRTPPSSRSRPAACLHRAVPEG